MFLAGVLLMFLITALAVIANRARQQEQHRLPQKGEEKTAQVPKQVNYEFGWLSEHGQGHYSQPHTYRVEHAWRVNYNRVISNLIEASSRNPNIKTLLLNWKQSVAGLLMMSDTNLDKARHEYRDGEYISSAANAYATIENISRALIHCCGGVAETTSGQEEALRLTLRRFEEEDKIRLEETTKEVENASANRQAWKSLASVNTDLVRAKIYATEMIQSAVAVQNVLKQIIKKHFSSETQSYFEPNYQRTFTKSN